MEETERMQSRVRVRAHTGNVKASVQINSHCQTTDAHSCFRCCTHQYRRAFCLIPYVKQSLVQLFLGCIICLFNHTVRSSVQWAGHFRLTTGIYRCLRCLHEYWLHTKTIEVIQILWSIYGVAYQLLLTVFLGSRAGNFLVSDFWMAASHHHFFLFPEGNIFPPASRTPSKADKIPGTSCATLQERNGNIKHPNNYFTLLL